MAQAVADVTASLLDSLDPVVEIELAARVDIAAAQADALAVDAGEIRLAADPAAVAAIQRVVPDVELPIGRRVDRGDEVTHAVGDIHEILVGADAVHHRQEIIGDLPGGRVVRLLGGQAPATVSEADHAALGLG